MSGIRAWRALSSPSRQRCSSSVTSEGIPSVLSLSRAAACAKEIAATGLIRHNVILRTHNAIHEVLLREEVISLFHELADLAPPAREAYYATRKVPPDL